MSYRHHPLLLTISSLLVLLMFSAAGFADDTAHDRTQFGSDINVGPNDTVGEITCFGCSVRVRGHVTGDATVFGGSIIVEDEGEIGGDVTDFGRGVRLGKDTKVGGDVTVFGGPVRRDTAASVGGDVTNFSGGIWLFMIFGLPLIIFGAIVALIIWVVRRLTRPSVPVTA
ncbi:MAG TPA: hypothetical protein VMD99_05280 [Terriglobales bacterium]|nr:hypothetical protein [Terriglobales bacterium]